MIWYLDLECIHRWVPTLNKVSSLFFTRKYSCFTCYRHCTHLHKENKCTKLKHFAVSWLQLKNRTPMQHEHNSKIVWRLKSKLKQGNDGARHFLQPFAIICLKAGTNKEALTLMLSHGVKSSYKGIESRWNNYLSFYLSWNPKPQLHGVSCWLMDYMYITYLQCFLPT